VKVITPEPVCPVPDVTARKAESDFTVHAHVAAVVTVKLVGPAVAPTLTALLEIVNEQAAEAGLGAVPPGATGVGAAGPPPHEIATISKAQPSAPTAKRLAL
jgi:hypothetical protein